MKKNILFFVLGLLIAGSIGVYATTQILASDIDYKNGQKVSDALDDLYSKANNKKVCLYVEGTKGQIGSKYLCDPGDGISRYFYILKVNTNDVELIMDKNISDTVGTSPIMTWQDAVDFFNEGHSGYSTKQAWTSVISVDLPAAQAIANAGGISNWDVKTATVNNWSYFGGSPSERTNYKWLYNYTIGCRNNGCDSDEGDNYGYWTKDLVQNDTSNAWNASRSGILHADDVTGEVDFGVRPVITISSNQLSN